MLTPEETSVLLKQAKQGNELAKEKLLTNNTSLLKSIIKRFIKKGVEYDDLYQLASMGMVKAINNFDDKFNVRFSTYAVPMIIGEIKRFLRDDGSVKVSRIIKTLGIKINRFEENRLKLGEPPSDINSLAKQFEVSKEDIVLAIGSIKPIVSLSETVTSPSSDKPIELIDKLPSKETEDDLVDKIMLKQIISELPDREKKIIILRYYRDKTQGEIAKLLGVSQVQVSRIETRIVEKLKSKM